MFKVLRVVPTLVLGGALATVVLGGCNAVLGIDEAEPRETSMSASTRLAAPIKTCNGPRPDACGTCVTTNCKGVLDECLQSHDCREALDNFRGCLGPSCSASSWDTDPADAIFCAASPQAALAAPLVKDVVNCALGGTECPQCPSVTPLVEICELYCGCMEQQMPLSAGADAVGRTCEQYVGSALTAWKPGDHDTCLTECRKLSLNSAACRFSHCQLATGGDFALHCQHAVDGSRCPTDAQGDPKCTSRRINGWGCDLDAQCCGHCVDHICAD